MAPISMTSDPETQHRTATSFPQLDAYIVHFIVQLMIITCMLHARAIDLDPELSLAIGDVARDRCARVFLNNPNREMIQGKWGVAHACRIILTPQHSIRM